MRLNWRNTFIIGLGFFAIALVWPIYNAYMPLLYAKYLGSKADIGWVMTIDNWLALTLMPVIGFVSDRTRTRFGRRIPYLLVGAPLAALFLVMIPFGWATSLITLVAATVLMNLSMASFRSPVVALMPDVTPAPLRSRANGIINFMGGLGFVAATFGGSFLWAANPGYPFYAAAALLVAVTLIFLFWIREPGDSTEQSNRFRLGRVQDRNALFMLLAIFFWFVGYNSVETWLTTYGTEHLGMKAERVSLLLTVSGAAFLLMAIPAGFLAEGARGWKGFGRKGTILTGLVGMSLAYLLLHGQADLWKVWPALLLVGLSWAFININSYPMITQMAGPGQIGAYTGLYYLFSTSANIAGPPLFGWVFDRLGYTYFFPLAITFMVLAAGCMLLVRRGEARTA